MPYESDVAQTATGVTLTDNILSWKIQDNISRFSGKGTFVIKCSVGEDVVKHTEKIRYVVGEGYTKHGEAPAPLNDYIVEIEEAISRANSFNTLIDAEGLFTATTIEGALAELYHLYTNTNG